jgi:hypothetical protein
MYDNRTEYQKFTQNTSWLMNEPEKQENVC